MKTQLKEKMMDVALEHIYKVNADPDVELEDVDAYDAWIPFDKDWDLNVHEANFGFENSSSLEERTDTSKFVWYACAYPLRRGEDGYIRTIAEEGEHLLTWEKKGKVTFITDQ